MTLGSTSSLVELAKKLRLEVSRLRIGKNFNPSHVAKNIVIEAGTEKQISHTLNVVPSARLFIRHTGGAPVVDGSTWDAQAVSFKNLGSDDAILDIVLFLED